MLQKPASQHHGTDPSTHRSWGSVQWGDQAWDREFLNWALGPSGTGLENRQAGLIFSQRSKYCPPYFSTGNPVMSWKQGLPRNSVPWGRGEEEHGCLAFFL